MINRDDVYELLGFAERIYDQLDIKGNSQETITGVSGLELRNFCKKILSLLNDITKEDSFFIDKPLMKMGSDIVEKIISVEPISISSFVNKINDKFSGSRKIKIVEITNWLLCEGYLEEKPYRENKYYKEATNKGISIGIEFKERTSDYGKKYGVNYYNKDAQMFILKYLGFGFECKS